MHPLSAPELLHAWEQGMSQSLCQRALTLLAAACPEAAPDALAALSIGERDARLLTLREWTFGTRLACVVPCPQCGEQLELAVNTADIRTPTPPRPLLPQKEGEDGDTLLSLCVEDYAVRFCLPNSLDLSAMADRQDISAARQVLLARCLHTAQRRGEPVAIDHLPANVVEAIVEHMAQADPQADVQFALACPQCGHQWRAPFDIAGFFWSELAVWAHRVLNEVHALASAYGWRESDILAMSPWRRQHYLSLVHG